MAAGLGFRLIYLFDKYELNDADFCLFREGQRVPLEPRALRVLLLFVDNPGKLLQKSFILESVWTNTFVEESTLTRAITILRKQLGDDPRAPTYIETVPTLGYRFIAKVTTEGKTEDDATTILERPTGADMQPLRVGEELDESASSQTSQTIEGGDVPASESLSSTRSVRAANPRLWILLSVLILAAGGSLLWWRSHTSQGREENREEKKTIVISDFENSTGDTIFDGTLREGITVQLEQSPVLRFVSESRIRSTLLFMNQPADTRLTPRLAREVCQRTNSAAMLDGSIAALGSQYVITLHATNCDTGDNLDTEQVQAATKEDVLHALSTVASSLRSRLGESLSSIQSLDTPLAEATTSSLDALKAFSESNRVENESGSAAAIPLARRAVELDPKFAAAWAILGRLYGDIGQELSSAESTAKAYEFRNQASEHERFFIVASYEMQVTGNLEKAQQTCDTWTQIYPNDAGSYGFRAGLILRVFGQYDKAVGDAEHLVDLHPDFALAYHFVALNDIALGRYKEAEQIGERAAARNLDIPYYALDQFRLGFLTGDKAAVERVMNMSKKMPGRGEMIAGQQASSFAYHGQLNRAREVSEASVNFMRQSGRPEAAARSESGAALREAFFGNRERANQVASAALDLSRGRDAEYGAAIAFALAENSDKAESLADDLAKRFPEDTSVRFHYVPVIRALVALNHRDAEKAVDLLKVNVPYELGSPQSSFSGFYGVLYPVYVRGLAYLMLHRGGDAANEFHKILDHPGLVANDPIGALAHLQLGRAYVQSGDVVRAQAAFLDFLNLWNGGDQDLPVLRESQREFARIEVKHP